MSVISRPTPSSTLPSRSLMGLTLIDFEVAMSAAWTELDPTHPSQFSRGEFSARQIPLTLAVFFLEGKFCKPNNQHTMCEVDFSSNSPLWQFTPRHSFNELYSHKKKF